MLQPDVDLPAPTQGYETSDEIFTLDKNEFPQRLKTLNRSNKETNLASEQFVKAVLAMRVMAAIRQLVDEVTAGLCNFILNPISDHGLLTRGVNRGHIRCVRSSHDLAI